MKTYRDTTRTWKIIDCAKDGARMTNETSAISESSCRTQQGRLFVTLAKELAKGKGYLIATPNELMAKFPDLFTDFERRVHAACPDNDRKFIWGIEAYRRFGNKKFDVCFCPVC